MYQTFVELVRAYVNTQIELEQLEDWEGERFQYFAALPVDDPVGRLWSRLQSCIAELDRGHWTEDECRARLREALAPLPVRVSDRPVILEAGALAATQMVDESLPSKYHPEYRLNVRLRSVASEAGEEIIVDHPPRQPETRAGSAPAAVYTRELAPA